MIEYAVVNPIPEDEIDHVELTQVSPCYLTENVDCFDVGYGQIQYEGYIPANGDIFTIYKKDGTSVDFVWSSRNATFENGDDTAEVNFSIGGYWSVGEYEQTLQYVVGSSVFDFTAKVTVLPQEEGELQSYKQSTATMLESDYESGLEEYREAQREEIRTLIAEGLEAIWAAESRDAVDAAYDDTFDKTRKVFTDEQLSTIELCRDGALESVMVFGEDSWLEDYNTERKEIVKGLVEDAVQKMKDLADNAKGPVTSHIYDTEAEYSDGFEEIYVVAYDEIHAVPSREHISSLIVKLSSTKLTYNGSVQKPEVTVIGDGVVLPESEYVLTWSKKSPKNVGDYYVDADLIENYIGSNREYFAIEKGKNPMKVTVNPVTVKYSKLKKRTQTIKAATAMTVTKAEGKVTYKKKSGNKKITVSSSGKITVKKGLKKGTYKVKVKVSAKGNSNSYSGSKTVTVVIKVK